MELACMITDTWREFC